VIGSLHESGHDASVGAHLEAPKLKHFILGDLQSVPFCSDLQPNICETGFLGLPNVSMPTNSVGGLDAMGWPLQGILLDRQFPPAIQFKAIGW
jgi:hypothetical protein